MYNLPENNLNILGEKKIFIDGSNRVCYLLTCDQCGKPAYHPRYVILRAIKNMKQHFFCNQTCTKLFQNTAKTIICETCKLPFVKFLNQIKKTQHNFCCHKCAAIYHNKNKTYGSRRSKLENYLEENIHQYFEYLDVKYNNVTAINSELDIYIPSLKLAIQINGPLHFMPIYGDKKLKRIIELDEVKRKICNELNIKLFEIDTSKDTYFDGTKYKRWLEVKLIIENNLHKN